MDQIKIGKFIAELRHEKGMKQSDMAEKLGVSNKSVSRWETGKNMPDVSLFIPLCDLLGISVNELIAGERIEVNDVKKTNEIIVDTIDKSSKKINAARIICYIAVLIVEIGLSIAICITATPSDAMAVPIGGVIVTLLTAIIIGLLDIKMIYKMFFVPVSVIIFAATQLIYWPDIDGEEFMVYTAVIIISQIVLILISSGIVFVIKKLIKALKEKNLS